MKTLLYHQDSNIIHNLTKQDQRLADLFKKKNSIEVFINDNYFKSLCDTIIAQQLSSKVANVISKRVNDYFDGDITKEKINDADETELRALGLSFQKINYLKSLAECLINQSVSFDDIEHMTDLEVINMLIKVKGIGVWTAQMFLIFSLGREDVFAVGDLGLRNAVKKVYNNPDLTHDEIEEIATKWSPYRSVVSHFLWHAWDFE